MVWSSQRSVVLRNEENLDDKDDSCDDPTDPDESEERGKDSAGLKSPAGGEVAPTEVGLGRVACVLCFEVVQMVIWNETGQGRRKEDQE
ncbi:hypothetical protein D9758_009606 [Tetrapyrgos nigripes]|uniref:Uncharacterized protein n=1 Tax=Tetrapyrgos nigripes TaxID=182062 RepID=A0A8H5LMI2_9AGAR|nr:hypothetical protein D9758_009606 [Tetrapyrgos nigripes]